MINKIEENIEKVAIYTRVSTDEQANEGFSLELQLDRLRAYCTAREWTIVGEYIDPGYSGRNIRRPQYQKMMQDIDKWDGILVLKMDRIHRNQTNFNQMMLILAKNRKQFVSMQENFDRNNATGRLIMDITQRIAQYESELTGERVFMGMEQKAKNIDSGYIGGRLPFGYRMDKSDPENHKIIPVSKKLDLVKQAFQLYKDGFSFRQIGKKLGKANSTIKYWLGNCFYAGFERWCNYFRRATIKPVISIKLYNQTQLKIRERCHTHRHYKPILLKNKDFFKIEDYRDNPYMNRSKLNSSLQ